MPRTPKKAPGEGSRTPGETVPRQYRLKAETLADLTAIAAYLDEVTGRENTQADAIRFAARETAKKISKNPPGSLDSVGTL